jgi:uncharacterized Zn finger protein
LTGKKESLPKCPQCGGTEIRKESRIVGGLIVQQVKKNGTVGPSGGARQITTVYCAECGAVLKDYPAQTPDFIKDVIKEIKEDYS